MEGPTPVSSLLHAATMVTAGIFLTTRCNVFFYFSYSVPIYIIFIGSTTSLFASLIGYFQNDMKKIVAYSTCSQLGYMFCSTGISSYDYAMYHLFNHAFFKALLFLSSGYLIHICSNEQNIRRLGGFIKIVPLPYICFFIGSLSLIGLPFFSGFFSKDLIVEKLGTVHYIYLFNTLYYNIIYISQFFLFLSLILTIKYSVKLIFYLFINKYNGSLNLLHNIHFSGYFITLPLFTLCLLSIISGYLFSDLMVGLGSFFWGDLLESVFFFETDLPITVKYYNFLIGDLPFEFNKYLFFSIYTFVFYYIIISSFSYTMLDLLYNFFTLPYEILKRSFINIGTKFLIFNRFFIKNLIYFLYNESYKSTYELIDKQIIEYTGPFGVVRFL
jgi:NADH-ubiquinone oxidoreductase chain 5